MDTNAYIIRKAKYEECKAIALLKRDVWNTTYKGIYPQEKLDNYDVLKNEAIFQNIYNNPELELYVVKVNHELVGLMTIGKPFKLYDLYKQELGLLYIRQDFQRKGIGTKLIQVAKEETRNKGSNEFILSVNTQNKNALAFYEAQGGKIIFEDNDQKRLLFQI